jgi:hypothetical protein
VDPAVAKREERKRRKAEKKKAVGSKARGRRLNLAAVACWSCVLFLLVCALYSKSGTAYLLCLFGSVL